MKDDNFAVLAKKVEKYYKFYAGKPHAFRMFRTILVIAVASLLFPFLTLFSMHYINLSRDSTIIEVETNINKALLTLKDASGKANSPLTKELISQQQDLWNRQAVLMSQLEKKVPRPDWIASSIKFMGWISALIALFVGLSSTIIAWRNERRATAQFILEMKERLAAFEKEKGDIIIP